MFNRLMILGVLGAAVLGITISPAAAKNHRGERPEARHQEHASSKSTSKTAPEKSAAAKVADDKGVHVEAKDDRGGRGKDDGAGHR